MKNVSFIRGLVLIVLVIAWTAQEGISAARTSSTAQADEQNDRPRREVFQFAPVPIQQSAQRPDLPILVESNLVVLDVLVTDEDGNVLGGLKKENFRVLDNGQPQIITQFEPTDDPITPVILMGYSGLAYDYFAYKAASQSERDCLEFCL